MNCCQCQGIEDLFNSQLVAKELAEYRKKGAGKTTRLLAEALQAEGVQGASLLDIGGGVGVLQHTLIAAGVEQATDVDASQAYLRAAQEEAARRGIADRIHFQHGNFVELAPQIPVAEIVTLDRVVCCFPDMEHLVDLSAARASKLYGLVYPRDTWLARIGVWLINLPFRLQRKHFRVFVHSSKAVDAILSSHGLKRKFHRNTLVWQVMVYGRE
jgi:hypothetical protein